MPSRLKLYATAISNEYAKSICIFLVDAYIIHNTLKTHYCKEVKIILARLY